ncbi:hypothetical protein H2202_002167 [Exophiala xenobiotica]|nr:hypothetical protein H2202_002167 [Exophiala xenobiotica]
MLVLTSTTGNLGSRILHTILREKLIPPSKLIISSTKPSQVSTAAHEAGIDIRQGDYTSPESLASSFRGSDALFLVSFPSASVERWLYHKAAIDAAKAVGVRTIIYTSLMFGGETGLDSIAGVQQAHIKTIEYLVQSGLQYVIVREGIYAEYWSVYAGFQPQKYHKGDSTEIRFVIPNDGPVAWVTTDDLAQGTARILQDYKRYIGQTLNLTGPRATSVSDIAKLVERIQVGESREEAQRYHKYEKKSMPADKLWVVDSWSGWHDAMARGETALVDPLLADLLGRQPNGVEEMAEQYFKPV